MLNKFPIHENLNTSFIDLSAMVEHLRGLQFVGSIHLEMSSYDADILFTDAGQILSREYDHTAGRISYGEHALESILERAKEPCGRINVYQSELETKECFNTGVYLDKNISRRARQTLFGLSDQWASRYYPLIDLTEDNDGSIDLPKVPFALRSSASEFDETNDDWRELLQLTGELLRTIEIALLRLNFDFAAAFENACVFASSEMHFIDPETGFRYQNGEVTVGEIVSTQAFVSGTTAALSHVFTRLREESEIGNLLHPTLHSVRLFINYEFDKFEKFGILTKLPAFLV